MRKGAQICDVKKTPANHAIILLTQPPPGAMLCSRAGGSTSAVGGTPERDMGTVWVASAVLKCKGNRLCLAEEH